MKSSTVPEMHFRLTGVTATKLFGACQIQFWQYLRNSYSQIDNDKSNPSCADEADTVSQKAGAGAL